MSTAPQPISFTDNAAQCLSALLREADCDKVFILVDETTQRLCLGRLEGCQELSGAKVIAIGASDACKNVESLASVWQALGEGGGSRRSLLVNVGGGMVTDLGGFAASTFKRGIRFVNVPTTLLAMTDASVGGKTGINFNGLKNEVGVFSNALHVVIDTNFLATLDDRNIRSGYAEMLKHGLISNVADWAELLNFDLASPDLAQLSEILKKNILVKERIVLQDPHERGLRKALNVGHTVGHAFESFALAEGRPVLHGYAVAWGMVCELYLSVVKAGFPKDKMRQTVEFIRHNYGTLEFGCNDYERLYALMKHDKKNTRGFINFTLLGEIGDIRLDQTASHDEIFEALDFFREQF